MNDQARIKPVDKQWRENLAQYIIRTTFLLARIRYTEVTGTVVTRLPYHRVAQQTGKIVRLVFEPVTEGPEKTGIG